MRQVVFTKFFIFSASRHNLDVNSNKQRTMEVARFLEESNVNFACVTGVYKGQTEASFMVLDASQEELVAQLCGLYNQDCYLVREQDNQGYLVYPNGHKEELGTPKEITREEAKGLDAFTILPQSDNTKKYFTFVKES